MWSGKEEESRMTPAFPAWVTVYIQSVPFTEVRKTRASGLGMISTCISYSQMHSSLTKGA